MKYLPLLLALLLTSLSLGADPTPADVKLRCMYLQEVQWIGELTTRLEGRYTEESIARAAHKLRRQIGEEYKKKTSPEVQAEIRKRNLLKYNDPLGPSIKYLRGKGLTWKQIIEGSSTPGGTDLLEPPNCPCIRK